MLKERQKRVVSLMLASTMLASTVASGNFSLDVKAQQASGKAPFANTWLVSGPFDTAVADKIYNDVVPENPNLAQKAHPSVSSETLAPNPASFLIDGSAKKQWVTEGTENPCWAKLTWDEPITVGSVGITLWNDGRHKNQWYDLVFEYADGSESDPVRVNSTVSDASAPTVYQPKTPFENVKSMKVLVDPGLSPYPSITGISEIEVYQYAQEVVNVKEGREETAYVNIAGMAEVKASSTWQTGPIDYPGNSPSGYTADKAVDGNRFTEWISQMHDSADAPENWPVWDPKPTFTLDWDNTIEVKEVHFYDRHNDAWPDGVSDIQEVKVSLLGKDGKVLAEQEVTEIDHKSLAPGKAVFETAVKDVDKVVLEIIHDGEKKNQNIGLGFTEVEVYAKDEGAGEETEPTANIDPTLGEKLEYGEESGAWEYFDDRIYNRNYDDYQDLNGYYAIKQGIDTKNKFVYAHTYVYSDKEQPAQVRVGASGSYRVYFNDRAITKPSTPAEVQKDMVKKNVTLKKGWNKLLIQMEHTYTEDVNENGVPVAQDQNVSYLGFYGRITDLSGNEIDGLVYSVEGGKEGNLEITTQGLKDGITENTMPTGYREWPYVWNKSTTNNVYGLSASAFQFMANGGEPGYTWEITEGKLPDGLELTKDGKIADGLNAEGKPDLKSDKGIIPADCEEGDYTFTVQVTDKNGDKATKEFTIPVKERPNKWFEEGRVGALSHCITIPTWSVDPNFSADLWAERAKRQGHSLVSIEAGQQHYYWPSKFDDPNGRNKWYLGEDGKVPDGLKQFEEAVRRYGMKFGLYYPGRGTDMDVQDVSDLIERYSPDYIYYDGPQFGRNQNFDVTYSNIRNYNDEIIINSNAWGEEYGDPDLGTHEASGIYANVGKNHFVKKVVFEPWKSLHTKNNYTPYYAKRDDYAQVAKEMIMNAGRGYVDNNDQMPLMSRGVNWDSPEDVATRYPKSVQEFIDVREDVAAWFAPEGYSERHESTTGTTPYFLEGYGFEDDGKGNYDKFAHPDANVGPQWGYATSRDNNIYLHIMSGPDGKKGFAAIENDKLTISPVKDKVESVIWLNKDKEVAGFEQDGDTLTIDLSNVKADKVDSIIKIVTDKKDREYKLTKVYVEGKAEADGKLQLDVEGQMTYPALKANLEKVEYTVSNDVVTVDKNGLVTAVKDGTAVVTVTGTYEGVTVSEDITVSVKDGVVFADDEILTTVLHVEDREMYGEFSSYGAYDLSLEGRAAKGGATGLNDAEITWHTGSVDLQAGDNYTPIKVTEDNTLRVVNGKVIPKPVEKQTRAVIWADVKKDGKTYTTNRVYMDLRPAAELAKDSTITASVNEDMAANLVDGKAITGTLFDSSKWTAEGDAWVTFELPKETNVSEIDINFNTKDQKYINTPESIEIQTSKDGKEWTTQDTVEGPTGNAYFGFYTPYKVKFTAKYVRLQVKGRNGAASDLMEVQIMGDDVNNTLSRIGVEAKPSENKGILNVDIKGYDRQDNVVDLKDAQITMTSEDANIAKVNADNTISAVNPGKTVVNVQVVKGNGYAESVLYIEVDEEGNISLRDYLVSMKASLNSSIIDNKYNKEIGVTFTGKLNSGESADLAGAEVTAEFSNDKFVYADGKITAKETLDKNETATVKFTLSLDGVTLTSEKLEFTVAGNTFTVPGRVEAEDGIIVGKEVTEENNDGGIALGYIRTGDVYTYFVDSEKAATYEISYRAASPNTGSYMQCFVNDELQAETTFANTGAWGTFTTNKHEGTITLKKGLNVIKMLPQGGDSLFNFNWFELAKVEEIADVDKTALTEAIAKAEGIDLNRYTEESTAVLKEAIEAAKAVVNNAEATQEEVDAAAKELQVAVDGLVKKVANKTLLQETYDHALTLSTDGVVDSAKKFFETAVAEAKAVLENPDATQEEVNAALDKLLKGIWGLGIVQGDKTNLGLLIDRAEAMMAEKDRYVQKNWQQLVDALDAAKKVMDDGDALEEDVQKAVDDLLNAILAQRYKANKDNLQNIIDKAEGLDLSKYTKESVAALKKALKDAKAVMADENLSEDDQKIVDKATKDLNKAIEGLKLASDDSNDNNGGNSNNSGNKPADKKPDAPTTGDNGNIALWFVLAAASFAALIGRRRKAK